jgi:hypothetical protein
MEDWGCFEDMARSEAGFTHAVNDLREERKTFGGQSPAPSSNLPAMGDQRPRRRAKQKRQSGDETEGEERLVHEWAVSRVMAALASRDETVGHGRDVLAFRTEVLKGKLLLYEEKPIQDWITAAAEKQGVVMTLGDLAPGRFRRFLEYITPDVGWVQRIPVAKHSDLERLLELSVKLTEFYPWSQSQAATFVLTGIMPHVDSLQTEASLKTPLYVRSRVHLTVDPLCTPQEVAAAYVSARRDLLPFVKGRLRRLSERHATLAVFVFGREERPNREVLEAWNRWCDQNSKSWRYEHVSQFSRDAQQAMDRLLNFGTGTRRDRSAGGVDLIHA